MDYKGYTIDQIKSLLEYDADTGVFKSKISGKELIDRAFSVRHPVTHKVDRLYLSRVAIMFDRDDYIKDEDRVTFKDGDPYNNKIANLVVVPYKEVYQNKANNPSNYYLETEHEHIYVGSLNKLFVVRRGSEQSIYRTYDKNEAVQVRDRWIESNKTLNELDDFVPKWYKEKLKEQQSKEKV